MVKNRWAAVASWLLWCRLGAGLLTAASLPYTIDVWGPDEGLPQSAVITLIQTRDGYLWLGTLNGLVRFDGTQFTLFDENNTPGLKSARIVKLFEDSQGQLWIGTETAGVFLVRDGRVLPLDIGRGSREGRLAAIVEDPHGTVWLYTANGELCRYRGGQVDVWNAGAGRPSDCRALAVDDAGLLWVGTDQTLSAVRVIPGTNSSGLDVRYQLSTGKLDYLLASKQGGYWRLANGRIQKWNGDRQEKDLGPYPWRSWLSRVNTACEDEQGNLVVGTGGEGLFWFDAEGKYVQMSLLTNGLSHDTVLSLCLDREGDLWVGTDGGGLNRVKRQVFHEVEESRGGTVQSVCAGKPGELWVGYNAKHIDHWSNGQLQVFTNVHGLVDLNVRSVLVDRDQRVWAGTLGRGLLQLRNGLFLPAPGSGSLSWGQDVSALFQDRNGRLWAGTQAGLGSWDGTKWKLMTMRDGLSGNVVRALADDRQGNLWIGTEGGGLDLLREGRFSCYRTTNGLPSDNVSALYVDADDVLWVGTSRGLARFQGGAWFSYANRLGAGNGPVGYLLEDSQGNLWLGSNTGLKCATKKDLDALAAGRTSEIFVRSFGRPDGLPTRECTQGSQPAACRTADGRCWFPTTKGLVWLDPLHLRRNTNPPPVVIESVWVDGELQGSNTLRAAHPQMVTIPAGKEGLEIDFASLNLSAPDKGRFRYILQGHEKTETEVPATLRSVHYTKLPPGHYTFQVAACNEDGFWSQGGAALAVTVQPPFWRTWWFILATTLVLLAMIVGSVHYVSTQRLQRQLAALRQQEALEHERARIARDLHDQLGANLTQVALLSEMAEADKDLPNEVESHARQIAHTARETTRALDEIVWTVNPSNDTLDGLVNYICKYAQEYLGMANLRYRLEVPPDLPNTPISPELRHNVFLAAKEAVNNVVKHAQASAAWVRLRMDPSQFTLEIEDNGRGLPPDAGKKGRHGLANMRKRLEDVGGQFNLTAGREGGTCVRLIAPLHNTHPKRADAPPASV